MRVLVSRKAAHLETKKRYCPAGILLPEALVERIEGGLVATLHRLGICDELHPRLSGSGAPLTDTAGAPLPDVGPNHGRRAAAATGGAPRSVRHSDT